MRFWRRLMGVSLSSEVCVNVVRRSVAVQSLEMYFSSVLPGLRVWDHTFERTR
jgi:hypothetical protein